MRKTPSFLMIFVLLGAIQAESFKLHVLFTNNIHGAIHEGIHPSHPFGTVRWCAFWRLGLAGWQSMGLVTSIQCHSTNALRGIRLGTTPSSRILTVDGTRSEGEVVLCHVVFQDASEITLPLQLSANSSQALVTN